MNSALNDMTSEYLIPVQLEGIVPTSSLLAKDVFIFPFFVWASLVPPFTSCQHYIVGMPSGFEI